MSYEETESNLVPISLQMASVAFCLHALAWMINVSIIAYNFGMVGSLWRPGITFVLSLLVGAELLAGKKWAWFIALLGMLVDVVRSSLGFAGLTFMRANNIVSAGELNILLFLIDIILLVAGLFYILHGASRRACGIGR